MSDLPSSKTKYSDRDLVKQDHQSHESKAVGEVLNPDKQKPSMADLSVLLDQKEKERERNFLEMSNPRVYGGKTIKWAGFLNFIQSQWNRWVWSSYGEEVNRAIAEEKLRQEKQERRAKRQQQKEQEGQNQAALPQEPKDPKDP